jgi:hypothetical protein
MESMDVESSSLIPTPLPQFQIAALPPNILHPFYPCPHTNRNTILYSVNSLWKKYNGMDDKPCNLSPSCFWQIWK